MAEATLEEASGKVYTLGPLIHNPQVVNDLWERGLEIIPDDVDALQDMDLHGAHVVIRSHGVSPQVSHALLEKGAVPVDATCPTVKKAQRAALRIVGEGYKLFIIGDAEHPELRAILGHINEEAVVLRDPQELKEWWGQQPRRVRKVGLIAQTTVDLLLFRSLVDVLINEVPELISEVLELKIINTLCRNTLARQTEALQLAFANDLVLVVGGRESSNTEFLRRICESTGTRTVKIETAGELAPSALDGVERVAILGGASTPKAVVEEVRDRLTG